MDEWIGEGEVIREGTDEGTGALCTPRTELWNGVL
jgi:hypothetical protein